LGARLPVLAAGTMSGTGLTHVRFSPVKEAIEAQSGRLEFLKQALTLGLAGVAGLAALFIDADKVPTGLASRLAVCTGGLALLAVVFFALCGIGTYAQFLRLIEQQETTTPPTEADVAVSRRWIANFINCCLIALFIAGVLLIAFAGIRVFSARAAMGSEQALDTGRRIIEKQLASGQSATLDNFASEPNDFVVRYVIDPTSATYVLRIDRASGEFKIDMPPPSAKQR
jgi:hypothetical protein